MLVPIFARFLEPIWNQSGTNQKAKSIDSLLRISILCSQGLGLLDLGCLLPTRRRSKRSLSLPDPLVALLYVGDHSARSSIARELGAVDLIDLVPGARSVLEPKRELHSDSNDRLGNPLIGYLAIHPDRLTGAVRAVIIGSSAGSRDTTNADGEHTVLALIRISELRAVIERACDALRVQPHDSVVILSGLFSGRVAEVIRANGTTCDLMIPHALGPHPARRESVPLHEVQCLR